MANVFIEESTLTAIGNAIRGKTGSTELILPSDMPTAIEGITTSGGDGGYEEGYAAGKSDEWNAFWDAFQQNGDRTDYSYAFRGACWSDVNFKPKYNIIAPEGFSYAFRECEITDLKGILEQQNIALDTSSVGSFAYAFNASSITRLPVVDASSATNLQYTFYNSKNLVSIEKLILNSDGSQTFPTTFVGCSSLEEIRVEGCIGASLSFNNCNKLSHDSLMSIINALKTQEEGITTKPTLTLKATNLGKLSDAEKAIVTQTKGWSLA